MTLKLPLDELLSRRLDAALQDGDAERLGDCLKSDPRSLEIYLDLIELDTFLVWELTGETGRVERIPVASGRTLVRACVVAVCALVSTIGAVWMFRPTAAVPGPVVVVVPPPPSPAPEPAPVVERPQIGTLAEIEGAGTVSIDEGDRIQIEKGYRLRIGDRLAISRNAFVTLQLDHGVRLLVEGPSSLDLTERDRITLQDGRLLGTVSPAAKGFSVAFRGGVVRDLGTQFAVATSESRPAEVKLLNGVVELMTSGDQPAAPPVRLSQSGGVRVNSTGVFETADDSSTWLDSIVAFEQGIGRIDGAVRYLDGDLPAPDFRRAGDPRIDVYLEQVGRTLVAPIKVQTSSGGAPGLLPEGIYDCYLLRLAHVSSADRKALATGAIVFRSPVAGWIADAKDLASSDEFVASPDRRQAWLRQSDDDRKSRGWEPSDIIALRPDGRTLDLTLNASTAIDEVRVFVRAAPNRGLGESRTIQN